METTQISSLEQQLTAEWERIIKTKPMSWKSFLLGKYRRAIRHKKTDFATRIKLIIDNCSDL